MSYDKKLPLSFKYEQFIDILGIFYAGDNVQFMPLAGLL